LRLTESVAALATAAARLSSLVEMHDMAVRDVDQLEEVRAPQNAAGCHPTLHSQSFKTFQDILSGVSSLADVDKKLDALLAAGKVDPALLLTTSKMYMSVKESPYTSEEVKDIMAHLYWRMKKSMAELQPPEVRILKMLLSTDDPLERVSLMEQAFTPGAEMTVGETDYLNTCARASPACAPPLSRLQHAGENAGRHQHRPAHVRRAAGPRDHDRPGGGADDAGCHRTHAPARGRNAHAVHLSGRARKQP